MKVSFDFDETLSRKEIQEYAKYLIEKGYEVHVTTTRYQDDLVHKYTIQDLGLWGDRYVNEPNYDLWAVCELLGIPKERVKFTNHEWKAKHLDKDFIFHIDDNSDEYIRWEEHSCCIPFVDSFGDWKEECEYHLSKISKI